MTRKILSLKLNKKKETKQADEVIKDVSHGDPQKRFLNGVAVNPSQCIRLELGSKELTMRAMDLVTPIGMGQRGFDCCYTRLRKNHYVKTYLPVCGHRVSRYKIVCVTD